MKDFERFHFKNSIICVFLHVGKCIYECIAFGGLRRTLDPLELDWYGCEPPGMGAGK